MRERQTHRGRSNWLIGACLYARVTKKWILMGSLSLALPEVLSRSRFSHLSLRARAPTHGHTFPKGRRARSEPISKHLSYQHTAHSMQAYYRGACAHRRTHIYIYIIYGVCLSLLWEREFRVWWHLGLWSARLVRMWIDQRLDIVQTRGGNFA